MTKTADAISAVEMKPQSFEREWNLWEVARIRYGEIPALEKEILETENSLKTLHDNWKSFLRDKVDAEDIAEIISKWTWIPATKLLETEKEKMLNLENYLKEFVVWQDKALKAVSNAIRRAKAWLNEETKPLWSFLFLWPTWVWKTETAKALANLLFNDKHAFIRIDMSEYMEKHSVSRLIGSPPWYVGYEEWWQLTEAVRRKPYSVILFDEIEKAHSDVFNTLLQVLDDWRLTDSKWRTVNFKNTIIILTSNIWSQLQTPLNSPLVKGDEAPVSKEIMNELKKYFRPEFLNRIDDIIVFNPLSEEVIIWIVDVLLKDVEKILNSKNIKVIFSDNLKKYLIKVGYDREFWARPMKRAITNVILNQLSIKLLNWEVDAWSKIILDVNDNWDLIVR